MARSSERRDRTVVGYSLNPEARRENIRSLAVAAGLSEEEASERLEVTVLVTHDSDDPVAAAFVAELVPILSRTLDVVCHSTKAVSRIVAELVVGNAPSRFASTKVFLNLTADRLVLQRTPAICKGSALPHRLMVLVAACYVTGALINAAVGDGCPNPPPTEFEIPFGAFLPAQTDLAATVTLGEAYLAGAGAIGNGLLWAARHVRLVGTLNIVDDDVVSPGNLQRQIWFERCDIEKPKAERLAMLAQPSFPECTLKPAVCRLQQHPARNEGAWLGRLIVAVDSRPARRNLQNELPGEVFDASTSGSQEVVLHHNKQPNDHACLGCVYPHDEEEVTHEQAVADHLGIDVESVRQPRISPEIARRICERHTQLAPANIEGLPFDTLYKQLCGSAQLKSVSGEQVVAPFAFVSVLAGALLLLEIIRQVHDGDMDRPSNEWRVNPWRPPVPQMRCLRPRREACDCCSRIELQRENARLWGIPNN